MRRASLFDWDGTLTDMKKVFLTNDFVSYLSSLGAATEGSDTDMKNLISLYKSGKIRYRDAVIKVLDVYASSIKGMPVSALNGHARAFASKVVSSSLHPYSKSLVSLMNGYGITIAISGAPHELICALGDLVGFSLSYGSVFGVEKGIFTGKLEQNLAISEGKEATIAKIVKENDIDLESSFAFGDTLEDLPLLSKAGTPVALNPDSALLSVAKDRRWMSFNSGDDVVDAVKKAMLSGTEAEK
jgi:HAD superfamily phosphoserine phosphatase-like hydrolase